MNADERVACRKCKSETSGYVVRCEIASILVPVKLVYNELFI
jgi:hypothetical protein